MVRPGGKTETWSIERRWLRARNTLAAYFLAATTAVATTAPASAIDLKTVDETDGTTATISMSGAVSPGDSLKVRSFVGKLADSKAIVAKLDVAGGNRSEAMAIGRFFHQASIRTVIPGKGARCVSPCPLILVGGRDPAGGEAGYVKYSSGLLGFSGVTFNYPDKTYSIEDLNGAVAAIQRDILQIADYLHDVGADVAMLRYYQSVLKHNEIRYITNEQALDLGIAILFEETGQLIEPFKPKRN